MLREVEQGAVDVEEQRPALREGGLVRVRTLQRRSSLVINLFRCTIFKSIPAASRAREPPRRGEARRLR